ncbi:NAD(P)H-binding protein [Acinetobacter indicus]|uniref:NAD(P)H-binding protein n=1 Tax=Acinetobacter indicus TaxID=756892 RepID=UPI000CEC5AF2|nr:NAD(P)H-binding protein [Acinetobacter indicus]
MTQIIKKAIVIGSTGLVGRALVSALNDHPDCQQVTAVVRRPDAVFEQMAKVQPLVLEDLLMLNDQDVSEHSHGFSCLGTTLKKAGSKDNFYATDFTINAHFAELLQQTSAHYLLVSALGANARSPFFYNRVKGELEQYIQNLSLSKVSLLRPSLLLGERQDARFLEDLSQQLFQRCSSFLPKNFKHRPVTAGQVAHTMVEAALTQTEKFEIYDNLRIQHTK